ncbi:Syntaxin-binding protein 2 [Thoreauomyces humboldtii]|nr:Syntaxin-binding protein 2 [Thoreauomyces humboldtii]
MPASLRDGVRKRILVDCLKSVQSPGKWKVLVVDEGALRVLNSVCDANDLSDVNVPVTETLSSGKRTPYPEKEAIYLISPTETSIQQLIADFAGPKLSYSGAHIFCIAALPDWLFDQIKRSAARKHILTLKEINIDFTPYESQVFHLNNTTAFIGLHDVVHPSQVEDQLLKVAEQMKSVLWTLEDDPIIRYFDPAGDKTSLSAHMAYKLETALEELKELDPDWPPESPHARTQIIVLDRSVDPFAPVIHSLTYQAAVQDLLQVDGTTATYTRTDNNDKAGVYTAILDDADPVYKEIRHLFVADAWAKILEMKKKVDSDNSAMESSGDALKKIEALKAKLFALPDAQKLLDKLVVHIHLYGEIMQAVVDRQLDMLATWEQILATGEAPNGGKVPESLVADLTKIMEDSNVTPQDKLRVLLVYASAVEDADPLRLADVAQLGSELDAIRGLEFLKAHKAEDFAAFQARYTDGGRKAEMRKLKKKIPEDELPYDIHRYIPAVKYILQDAIAGKLDPTIFGSTARQTSAASLSCQFDLSFGRKGFGRGELVSFAEDFQPTWATKRPSGGAQKEIDFRINGSRIILLFVDGLSFPEIRAASEVMQERQREIFIGSLID